MTVFMLETDDVDPRSRTDPAKRRIEYSLAGAGCVDGLSLDSVDTRH